MPPPYHPLGWVPVPQGTPNPHGFWWMSPDGASLHPDGTGPLHEMLNGPLFHYGNLPLPEEPSAPPRQPLAGPSQAPGGTNPQGIWGGSDSLSLDKTMFTEIGLL